MLLGESGLFAQSTVWQAAWCAAFGLPYAYMQCRRVADALVEEALGAASTLLLQVSCPFSWQPVLGVWASVMGDIVEAAPVL